MGTADLSRGRFNELVFENRNKAYGAYVIRKEYNERLIIAFLITFAATVSLFLAFTLWPEKSVKEYVEPPTVADQWQQIEIKPDEPKKHDQSVLPPAKKETKSSNQPALPEIVEKVDSLVVRKNPFDGPVDPNLNPGKGEGGQPGGGGGNCIDCQPKEPEIPVKPIPTENPASFPEFPGGYGKMKEFIDKNIHIPEIVWDQGESQKAYIYAIVDTDGTLYDLKILAGTSNAFSKSALDVVKMMPKWKPGMTKDGEKVPVIIKIPIKINLQN